MSAHTEGRLELGKTRDGSYIELVHTKPNTVGAISLVIARVTARVSWAAESMANARRLVACWNACVGLPTERLEDDPPIADRITIAIAAGDNLDAELEKRTAERDELLTLLIESQENIGGDWRERRDAVIAKSTGEQP